MHELSIVEALIEQTQEEVQRAGHHGRVVKLELIIGRLSGVCCDSIRFAFEILSPGTLLEGTEIHISEPMATCHCHACNARSEIDGVTVKCPECSDENITIDGGRDLVLQSIEIED